MLKEHFEPLLRAIVTSPDKVKLEESASGDEVFLTIAAAPEDIGKVLGKRQRTIKALRVIAHAIGHQNGKAKTWVDTATA